MKKIEIILALVTMSLLVSCKKTEQEQVIDYLKEDVYSLVKNDGFKSYKLGGSEEEWNSHFTQKLKQKLRQEGLDMYGDDGDFMGFWIFGTYEPGADSEYDLISIEHMSGNKYLVLLRDEYNKLSSAIRITAFCEDGVVKLDDVEKLDFNGDVKTINKDYIKLSEEGAFNYCVANKKNGEFFTTDWWPLYDDLKIVTLMFIPSEANRGEVVIGLVVGKNKEKIEQPVYIYRYVIEGEKLILTSGKSISRHKGVKPWFSLTNGHLDDKSFVISQGLSPESFSLTGRWCGCKKKWTINQIHSELNNYLMEYLDYYD